jgi:hypothetical protein
VELIEQLRRAGHASRHFQSTIGAAKASALPLA